MKISYSQIDNYCKEMHNLAQEMKSLIETVNGVGKSVDSSSSWEGKASTYYTEKLNKVTAAFEEIYIEIENAILYLAKSAEGYQAIDQQILKEICTNLKISSPNLSKSKLFN